ncbi:MAG: diacylglycerol kinase family protein [Candidatus Levyibacteriota bacterium]
MHKTLALSFKYAAAGILHAFRYNQNLKIHLLVGIIISLLAVYLGVSHFEMGILGLMILLVMASEMINTSIEEMVDLITTEHRQEAKVAKDVAAGMVLLTAVGSVVVGILIFTPYILKFFR